MEGNGVVNPHLRPGYLSGVPLVYASLTPVLVALNVALSPRAGNNGVMIGAVVLAEAGAGGEISVAIRLPGSIRRLGFDAAVSA